MAKTDWQYDDVVKPEDMNELGEEINAKARIVVTESPPAVPDREAGVFYFCVTDTSPAPVRDNVRVNPNMAIKFKG